MNSLDQLLNFRSDSLAGTADAWHQIAEAVDRHIDSLGTDVRENLDRGVWAGEAGEAARGHFDRMLSEYTAYGRRLRVIGETLHSARAGFTTAQQTLNQALGIARQAGLDVGADGSVSWNLPRTLDLLTNPTGAATIAGIAGQVADLIGRSLDHASAVDTHTARALAELTPQGHVTAMRVLADPPPEDSAQAGQEDAGYLKWALDHPNDPNARALIDETTQDLESHKGDESYLIAFFRNGGDTDLTRLAAVLHQQDGNKNGTLLNDESETFLRRAADALATATRLPQLQQPDEDSPSPLAALTFPSDANMWSVAMLVGAPSGPKGTEWDPTFLRNLGESMLEWRDRTPQRPELLTQPGYMVPQFEYRDVPGNWYNALGVSGAATNVHSATDDPALAELKKYDPSYAILDRLGENPSASAVLLSGQSGAEDARQLMSPYWGTPVPGGFADESAPAAGVLEAGSGATVDPESKDHPPHSVRQDHPDDPRYAQSAANVFEDAAAYAQGGEKYTPQWGENATAGFPQDISAAQREKLTSIGACYVTDLGISSLNNDGGGSTIMLDHGAYHPALAGDVVTGVVKEIAADPKCAAGFQGVIQNAVGATAQENSPHPGTQIGRQFDGLGQLLGMTDGAVEKQEHDAEYQKQFQAVQAKALLSTVLNAGLGAFGNANVPDSLAWTQVTDGGLSPVLSAFLTGDVDTSQVDARLDNYAQNSDKNLSFQLGQALLHNGAVKPDQGAFDPSDTSWATYDKDGNVVVKNDKEALTRFESWWSEQAAGSYNPWITSLQTHYKDGRDATYPPQH